MAGTQMAVVHQQERQSLPHFNFVRTVHIVVTRHQRTMVALTVRSIHVHAPVCQHLLRIGDGIGSTYRFDCNPLLLYHDVVGVGGRATAPLGCSGFEMDVIEWLYVLNMVGRKTSLDDLGAYCTTAMNTCGFSAYSQAGSAPKLSGDKSMGACHNLCHCTSCKTSSTSLLVNLPPARHEPPRSGQAVPVQEDRSVKTCPTARLRACGR